MSDAQTKKTKRLVFTSVNQLISLAKTNEQILSGVPKFAPLRNMSMSTSPKKSCNCGGRTNFTTPDANKQTIENILSSMGTSDFLQIKVILGLDELCYYKRDTAQDKLELVCL